MNRRPESAGKYADTARVFFALWPDAQRRGLFMALSRELHAERGGRPSRPDTIHLTLLFLGAVPRPQLPALIKAIRAIQAPSFEISFDYTRCWRHNRIAFSGAHHPPLALLELVAALEVIATEHRIDFDRRAYMPHVSLVRHADCKGAEEVELGTPILWQARKFVLVESKPGREGITYPVLARFPLMGPSQLDG